MLGLLPVRIGTVLTLTVLTTGELLWRIRVLICRITRRRSACSGIGCAVLLTGRVLRGGVLTARALWTLALWILALGVAALWVLALGVAALWVLALGVAALWVLALGIATLWVLTLRVLTTGRLWGLAVCAWRGLSVRSGGRCGGLPVLAPRGWCRGLRVGCGSGACGMTRVAGSGACGMTRVARSGACGTRVALRRVLSGPVLLVGCARPIVVGVGRTVWAAHLASTEISDSSGVQ